MFTIRTLIGHREHLKILERLSKGEPVSVCMYSPGACPGTSVSMTIGQMDEAGDALVTLRDYLDAEDEK